MRFSCARFVAFVSLAIAVSFLACWPVAYASSAPQDQQERVATPSCSADEELRTARPLRDPVPRIGDLRRQCGRFGAPIIRFQVLPTGRSKGHRFDRSSGCPEADRALTFCMRTWVFEPAYCGQTAIEQPYYLVVHWRQGGSTEGSARKDRRFDKGRDVGPVGAIISAILDNKDIEKAAVAVQDSLGGRGFSLRVEVAGNGLVNHCRIIEVDNDVNLAKEVAGHSEAGICSAVAQNNYPSEGQERVVEVSYDYRCF